MPENVIDAVSSCEDFATECEQFNVDFMRHQNAVSLDFFRSYNYSNKLHTNLEYKFQ